MAKNTRVTIKADIHKEMGILAHLEDEAIDVLINEILRKALDEEANNGRIKKLINTFTDSKK